MVKPNNICSSNKGSLHLSKNYTSLKNKHFLEEQVFIKVEVN